MATLLARGGAFANHAVAISAGVPTVGRMGRLVSLSNKDEQLFDAQRHPTSSIAMSSTAPVRSRMLAVSSLSGAPQVRFAHTDVAKVPDFSDYRKKSTISPSNRSRSTEMDRKSFTYAILFSGAVVVTYSAKAIVHSLVSNLAPNAKTLAESTIEVNLSTIPEGKNVVFKWRNKPLFVRHRTAEDIERERSVNVSELRDPEEDEKRVQKDEWLILVGVCTHLGCVPIANAGDFGGYYCPCHGSHYDGSGRIRKGPAPANLEVPEYSFLDEDTILVG